MLNKIIKYSLENKLLILVAAALLIIVGIFTARDMDVDVFPDLTAPTVVVMTDAHNMATEEVERLVSFPIETAVNGATNVRRVRSASMQGYSFVWVEFDWGMDIYKARQVVSEKMVALGDQLPQGVEPIMAPQSSVMGEIMMIGLQADSTSLMELRTLADWVVKPAILATGGVSQVTIIGGDYKQYQVLADPQKMNYYQITLDDLTNTVRQFSINSSGGVVREYGNEFMIRGMARTTDLNELGSSYIKTVNQQPVSVSDVAQVVIAPAVKMGYASQNGKPSILLSVSKQPHVNTLKVTEAISENLDNIQTTMPSDVRLNSHIFRQADFIKASVDNVGRSLLEGILFVIIILFLFLGSFRTTVISTLAIPLSLLGTIVIMKLLGLNINTMTLGGMCIAIGSLVDDAIIDVENVYKRLRLNHQLPKEERRSTFKVVFDGSTEIRASIINATLIIIVSFVPLFFLDGLSGRLLKPLGIAYIISLFMSLLVAMTLTPLLCQLLLSNDKYLSKKEKAGWIATKLGSLYQKILVWALNHKRVFMYSTLGLFVAAIVIATQFGQSFLPDFNEGSLTINVVAKPGTALTESNQLGNVVERKLLTIPQIKHTARRTGRGELDEHSQPTYAAEIDANYQLGDMDRATFFKTVRHTLGEVPGIVFTVGQPLGHRIDHMLSGTKANIAVKLFGTDLALMELLGKQMEQKIKSIDGLGDVAMDQLTEIPQLQIRANRLRLAQYGISLQEFHEFIATAFGGEKIGDIYEGQRSFDLMVRFNSQYTQDIEGIKSALIDTKDGKKVPIEEVADIISIGGPNKVSRENVQRKLVIAVNVAEKDLTTAVGEIQEKLESEINLPEGYRIEYGGQFESAKKATHTLILTSILAILVIFLLLYVEFKDLALSGIVLVNLPLALIGGIFAIWFTSSQISIPSIIGFITLFGIATRNGILLISNYNHLKATGISIDKAVITGSVDRLNPIIMTALTSGLALIPMILSADKPGNEIQSPMAIVVLGGLFTSTLLNIFIVPIVYDWFEKKQHKDIQL